MSGGKNCFQSNILSAIVVAQGNDKDPCSQYVRLEVRDLFIFAHPWLKRRLWRGQKRKRVSRETSEQFVPALVLRTRSDNHVQNGTECSFRWCDAVVACE